MAGWVGWFYYSENAKLKKKQKNLCFEMLKVLVPFPYFGYCYKNSSYY